VNIPYFGRSGKPRVPRRKVGASGVPNEAGSPRSRGAELGT
jgi:hypothetical protein